MTFVINWLTFVPALIGLGLLITVLVVITRSNRIDIYLTRTDLTTARKPYKKEFANMQKVWAMWNTGKVLFSDGHLADIRIEGLILPNPDNKYLMKWQEPISESRENDEEHITQHASSIRQIADYMCSRECKVRIYDGIIHDTLNIADEMNLSGNDFSDKAWARIETGSPKDTENRINMVIYKENNSDAFKALVKHYNDIWDRSDDYVSNPTRIKMSLGKLLLDGKEILVDLEKMDAKVDSFNAVSAEWKFEIWYKEVSKTLQGTDFDQLWDKDRVESNFYKKALKSDYIQTCKQGLDRLENIKQLMFDKGDSRNL